jgi:hypothetical protein
MAHRVQAFLILLLMALAQPLAGGSWAYCQRTGEVHVASAHCCCEDAGDASDGCGDGRRDHQQEPCCVVAGKLAPDALASTASPVRPPGQVASPADLPSGNHHGPAVRRNPGPSRPLRAPPPSGPRFLLIRSLRL